MIANLCFGYVELLRCAERRGSFVKHRRGEDAYGGWRAIDIDSGGMSANWPGESKFADWMIAARDDAFPSYAEQELPKAIERADEVAGRLGFFHRRAALADQESIEFERRDRAACDSAAIRMREAISNDEAGVWRDFGSAEARAAIREAMRQAEQRIFSQIGVPFSLFGVDRTTAPDDRAPSDPDVHRSRYAPGPSVSAPATFPLIVRDDL